jgi:Tol biopolymer transport system component
MVQSAEYISGLAVSPDGTQIAFSVADALNRFSTWVVPAPLGGVLRPLLSPGNSGLQWSPDGTRIAFIQTGGSLGDALIVADADGQNETILAKREGARHIHWPRWSGDGKYIYFNHGPQNFTSSRPEYFALLPPAARSNP